MILFAFHANKRHYLMNLLLNHACLFFFLHGDFPNSGAPNDCYEVPHNHFFQVLSIMCNFTSDFKTFEWTEIQDTSLLKQKYYTTVQWNALTTIAVHLSTRVRAGKWSKKKSILFVFESQKMRFLIKFLILR